MSLLRGIQSAIFFYVSCAPCFAQAHQRRRKRQNRRDRAEKREAELDQPDAYRHPDVGSINPYWSEEIALGPGPPPKKMGKKQRRAERTATATTQGSMGSRVDSSMDTTGGAAGITFGGLQTTSEDTLSEDGWNRRRYQREDEELWGSEEAVSMDGKVRISSSAGSSDGLVGRISRPGTGGSEGTYYVPRAAPVNDLHPPVASMPAPNATANKWMLQPPPSARVMSGKERLRSRSGSVTSSRVDVSSLQRDISVRKIEEKIARGETPDKLPVSRGSSYRASSRAGQGHDRDPRKSPSLAPSMSSRGSKRRSRVTATPEESEVSDDDDLNTRRIDNNALTVISGNVDRRAPKPRSRGRNVDKLSTVESSSASPEPRSLSRATTENLKPVLRHSTTAPMAMPTLALNKTRTASPAPLRTKSLVKPGPLTIRDSSLNVLQDLVSPPTLLNSNFIKSPTLEARIQLPPTDSTEELDLRSLSPWFPSDDFAVAAAGDEEDLAALRHRWSMDI